MNLTKREKIPFKILISDGKTGRSLYSLKFEYAMLRRKEHGSLTDAWRGCKDSDKIDKK